MPSLGATRAGPRGAVLAMVLAGCSILAPTDPRLCSAAQDLSQAMTLVATAVDADGKGDIARAQGLATQSRTLGEAGHATLDRMPDEEKPKPAFQALLEVYLHAGQAANALLPAYEGTHAMAVSELEAGSVALTKARAELPAMCFDLPADIETPGSS
ncbi:MAG TPA: hypothetical protein VL749_01355 [Patescibacteria group bacterium]|nr:hypothetical protein [Patescibacteria group bacterium]